MALRRRRRACPSYLTLLEAEPDEVRALYEDILIHVTSFFRDPEVFETAQVARSSPRSSSTRRTGAPIRVWVAGCSTGEEVYSLAISLLEFLGDIARAPIQIFGTDVSEKAIEKARAGIYSDAAMRDVSEERRRRFFTKVDRGYRINKTVRDLCVFVAARPRPRSAVLEARPGQLPQRPHLLRRRRCRSGSCRRSTTR